MRANDRKMEAYRRMLRIRRFEEQAEKLHSAGEIPGALHVYTGQEASGVGACMALRNDDYMVGTHRSHGHPIAKGAALKPLMAELLARATGICKGKGGSMHLSDFSVGSLGETSIVGSGLPVGVGAALGSKLQGNDRVALVFFGDGASNEGAFHESMNLAAIWKLPVIFLCENNGWAISTRASYAVPVADIAERAKAYAMPAEVVDGQDVDAVEVAVTRAVDRARSGGGPTLIETKTFRYGAHAVNMGQNFGEREAELIEARKRDPIVLYRERLLQSGIDTDLLSAIDQAVDSEVADAVRFARESPYPRQSDAFDDVFDEPVPMPEFLLSKQGA